MDECGFSLTNAKGHKHVCHLRYHIGAHECKSCGKLFWFGNVP
jgi:hypothetical protein